MILAGLAESSLRRHAAWVSDADLRELERRFRETGSVENEAAWLLERVRAGELTQDRFDLAGYCGSEAAGGTDGCAAGLKEFGMGFERWETEAAVRATIALARFSLDKWDYTNGSALKAIGVAEDWVVQGCRQIADEEPRTLADQCARSDDASPGSLVETAVAAARAVVESLDPNAAEEAFHQHLGRFIPIQIYPGWAPRPVYGRLSFALEDLEQEGISQLEIRGYMRAELVPWALGYGDPVRERVEARQRAEAAGE